MRMSFIVLVAVFVYGGVVQAQELTTQKSSSSSTLVSSQPVEVSPAAGSGAILSSSSSSGLSAEGVLQTHEGTSYSNASVKPSPATSVLVSSAQEPAVSVTEKKVNLSPDKPNPTDAVNPWISSPWVDPPGEKQ